MRTHAIFILLVLAAVASAGCAAPEEAPAADVETPSTPSPVATPDVEAPPVCPDPVYTEAAPGDKLGYPEYVFTVAEPDDESECFSFVGPESIPAGWTAITLQNNGMSPHIMPMMRLDDGKTFEEFMAAAATGAPPEWAVPVGGVGFATPFSSGTILIDLAEGTYVVFCPFEGHHMHGMIRPLEVTAAEAEPLAAPEATLEFTLLDFGYEVPQNITQGVHVAKFVNSGAEPHEAPLVALQEGVTMEEFLAAIEKGQGPPPGFGKGGINMLAPGGVAYAILDLEAGEHGFVCFVESHANDGAPHVALGMVTQFSVTAETA